MKTRLVMLWGAAAVALLAQPAPSSAGSLTVSEGYNLFAAGLGTSFPGLGDLVGVPLNTFDFGGNQLSVGNGTDTIVGRLSDITVAAIGDTGTTRLEMLALQLMTAAPVDFAGNGLDNYFVTLQSARGGPATIGSMDITFQSVEGGTSSSFFDVFFDIRKGSLAGPIVLADALILTNKGAAWDRDPPPGAVTIPGINSHLNGTNNDTDFWPVTPFQEVNPNGATYVATTASVPEPSTLALAAVGGLGLMGMIRRRKRA